MTILTPKGYTPARQPDSERPPEQPQPQAPSATGRPQTQLRFPPQAIGMTCPNCGATYPVPLFSVIDVGQDPVLRSVLLSGQVNMAVCPKCGAGGLINAPLLYHDPAHSFLGVYVPQQVPVNEQQRLIGQLSKRLMDGLPQEARRGYMLTPKQFLSYQSLIETILENEGITREMMDAQRRRLQLLEQTLVALQDPQGLKQLVSERDREMDDEFFGLLAAAGDSAAASGDAQSYNNLLRLRERLIELTTWGAEVQRQRAAVAQLRAETTPAELCEMVLAADEMRVVDALVTAARPLVTYSFFQSLADRIEAAKARGDEAEASRVTDLRAHILEYVDRLDQLQRAVLEQAGRVLSEILASNDVRQAVVEHADLIDQNFLGVLAANLQQAERQGATAAIKRLQEVWEAVMALMQEGSPPEIQLINELLDAEYPGETRKLLAQRRELVTADLVELMADIAVQLEEQGDPEAARKLRQIRSQAQLML